jgi:hypothetical protein
VAIIPAPVEDHAATETEEFEGQRQQGWLLSHLANVHRGPGIAQGEHFFRDAAAKSGPPGTAPDLGRDDLLQDDR